MSIALPGPALSWGPPDVTDVKIDYGVFCKADYPQLFDFLEENKQKADDSAVRNTGAFREVEKTGLLKDIKRAKKSGLPNRRQPKKNWNANARGPRTQQGRKTNDRKPNQERPGSVLRRPTLSKSIRSAPVTVDLLPFIKRDVKLVTAESLKIDDLRGRCFVYDNANDEFSFSKPGHIIFSEEKRGTDDNATYQFKDHKGQVRNGKEPPSALGTDSLKELLRVPGSSTVNVYITDQVLAAISAAAKSKASWDVRVYAKDMAMLFSERDFVKSSFFKSPCNVSNEWVRETAPSGVAPIEGEGLDAKSINDATNLAQESDRLQRALRDALLKVNKKGNKDFDGTLGATKTETNTQSLLRYSTYSVTEPTGEKITIIARSEIDGIQVKNNEKKLYRLFALLEGPPSESVPSWKSRVDVQPGKLLTEEMGLNSGKFARWAALALLSGAEVVKIAFCSRSKPDSTQMYNILHIETIATEVFAHQVGFSRATMWTLLSHLVHSVRAKGDGTWYIMKEPVDPPRLCFLTEPESESDEGSGDDDETSDDDSSESSSGESDS